MMQLSMLIGILETGRPPEEFAGAYPDYPHAFELLLGDEAPDWQFRAYAALDGELPASVESCDAWLITGSKNDAYDAEPWIVALEAFLREAYRAKIPIVGICFGHQLLAQALGGKVEKSPKGWGVGVHNYQLKEYPKWLVDAPSSFSIQAFHQDQVVELPDGASVVAESDFCPYAMLAYGDCAMSFQGHPEFEYQYVTALLQSLRGGLLPEDVVDTALEDVARPIDQRLSARWIVGFIKFALQRNATLAS